MLYIIIYCYIYIQIFIKINYSNNNKLHNYLIMIFLNKKSTISLNLLTFYLYHRKYEVKYLYLYFIIEFLILFKGRRLDRLVSKMTLMLKV